MSNTTVRSHVTTRALRKLGHSIMEYAGLHGSAGLFARRDLWGGHTEYESSTDFCDRASRRELLNWMDDFFYYTSGREREFLATEVVFALQRCAKSAKISDLMLACRIAAGRV